MDVELNAEAKDKKLNRLVATTVVLLSVFTGLCNIKDGNIVQAMQQAKADSVDRWNEYQATRTKLHISEASRDQLRLLSASTSPAARAGAARNLAALERDIGKYVRSTPALRTQALALEAKYDALNVHDDQFDASEALISTAISMAAVAALAESFGLLFAAWGFGAFGIFMGVCGFAGWAFHPDILSNFLG
jgi:hypothetical protein